MAAPDFPNAPTVGAEYVGPNGALYRWDGAVWTTTEAAPNLFWADTDPALLPGTVPTIEAVLTPGVTARVVDVPATTGSDTAQLIAGSTTVKERVRMRSSGTQGELSVNRTDADGQDDVSQPSWTILEDLGGDNLAV